MKITNPATGETIKTLIADDNACLREKYEKVHAGQKAWAERSVEDRLAIILRFGELVKEHHSELAETLSLETGKPISQAKGEVRGALNRVEHLKEQALKWLAPERVLDQEGLKEEIHYEPLGVIGNISAWNYPFNVGFNVYLYALTAGNGVLYKPSEFATLTGIKMSELLWEAGVPKDVFEIVIGAGNIGAALLELPLNGVFFTGSYNTGKKIAEEVAGKLIPVQLELGGKDPLYVMEDVVDVKMAAVGAAEGAFYNAGQSCCAVERIYVHHDVYDDFVEAFVDEVKSYKVGDPSGPETFIGPLTREPQLAIIEEQIQDALDKGAMILTGGHRMEGQGNYFQPTVLTYVTHDMKIMQEESFGPVIGIMKVSGDEEALKLMSDTKYGLTAAIFGSDQDRAEAILKQLNTGTAYFNCCDRVSPNLPWSGRGNSGLGSTLSYHGIRAFVQPKGWHLRR